MLSLTKFIGVIIIFFGLLLLFSSYEGTDKSVLDVIGLGLIGLLVVCLGVICWLWCEPYDDRDQY